MITVKYVHVHIDEPGGDIFPLELHDTFGVCDVDIGGYPYDAVPNHGDIHHPVDALGRINEMSSFQEQVI
jgi:hypothetical protein